MFSSRYGNDVVCRKSVYFARVRFKPYDRVQSKMRGTTYSSFEVGLRKSDEARARVSVDHSEGNTGSNKKSEGATGSEESSNERSQLRQVADVSRLTSCYDSLRLDRQRVGRRGKGRGARKLRVSDRGRNKGLAMPPLRASGDILAHDGSGPVPLRSTVQRVASLL